jgi:hypothetical protein
MRVEPQQGAFLIGSHHAAITGDVGGKNSRKPSLDPRTSHDRPRSSVLRAKFMGSLGELSIEARCPLWVKSRHRTRCASCPLYPRRDQHVRFVPIADIRGPLFYDFIGAKQERWRNLKPKCLCSLQVEH